MFGSDIWEAMVAFVIVVGVVCFALGIAVMVLAPKVWAWAAPIIHAATA